MKTDFKWLMNDKASSAGATDWILIVTKSTKLFINPFSSSFSSVLRFNHVRELLADHVNRALGIRRNYCGHHASVSNSKPGDASNLQFFINNRTWVSGANTHFACSNGVVDGRGHVLHVAKTRWKLDLNQAIQQNQLPFPVRCRRIVCDCVAFLDVKFEQACWRRLQGRRVHQTSQHVNSSQQRVNIFRRSCKVCRNFRGRIGVVVSQFDCAARFGVQNNISNEKNVRRLVEGE